MKHLPVKSSGIRPTQRAHEQGQAKVIVLVLAFILAGIVAGSFYLYRDNWKSHTGQAATNTVVLSASTKTVLSHLSSPVEIRYYSLLDPASVPGPVQAFAGRVDQMLGAFEQESTGKIKVTRFNSESNFNANAATGDGVKPFNLDKGDACYLGIAVERNGRKESFSRLAPEWEQALEFDLARAITRVLEEPKVPQPATPVDTAALEDVKRLIPNFEMVSLEEGSRLIRDAALAQFKQAAQEMDQKIKEARQNIIQAQTSQSEAEQQAAMKQLQELQAQQMENLKEIAAKSKAQTEALQQLKGAAR